MRILADQGLSRTEVRRATKRGELQRIGRGIYHEPGKVDDSQRHLARAYDAAPLSDGDVFSHVTAALLHGFDLPLGVWPRSLDVSRPGRGGGTARHGRTVHMTRLLPMDITRLGDLPVTTVARTIVDCARTLDFADGVTLTDRALRTTWESEAMRADLLAAAGRMAGVNGIGKARAVIRFASPEADSGGESVTRVLLHDVGLPPPVLQLVITDPDDPAFVARADFAWPQFRTVLEFDGAVKYGPDNPSGRSGRDVLMREKAREDHLRSLGWQVVRVTWDDLHRPKEVARSLRRAFERAAR